MSVRIRWLARWLCIRAVLSVRDFTRKWEAHAEVNAIASVKDESLLKDSTIYVSLSLALIMGKTPPCAELIIRKGIPRVVVGCLDPFPEVSGRGVRMLREAGVEVVTGVMEEEARVLNKAFMTLQTKMSVLLSLKWGAERGWVYRSFAYGRVGSRSRFVFSGDFPLGA